MSQTSAQALVAPDIAQTLQTRLVGFVRMARDNGFRVGVAEELDAQRVALLADIMNSARFRWGLRSLLCSDADDWERFDEMFDAYWQPGNLQTRFQPMAGTPVVQDTPRAGALKGKDGVSAEADRTDEGADEDAGQGGTREGASRQEDLTHSDFQFMLDSGQMRAVEQLVERLARRMRRRLVRRQKVRRQGRRIHLRRTLRNSLRFGGTPLQLVYRQRCKRQPRLILLVDVSRSMSLYSYVFLRFARGLVNAFRDADAFAYHTRLVHITDAMRQPDLMKVRESLSLISQGWSGGTRIGESLEHFNRDHGRLVNSRSVVIVVSDGLDTGTPEQLAAQLTLIKRRCRKLIWLNPLLGREGYEPRTGGMLAAMPLLDLFAPAHNVCSLMALESVLMDV